MQWLNGNKLIVDLQILHNEASAAYKHAITKKWNANYILVTPSTHTRNAGERAIRTFKAHFLSILRSVAHIPQEICGIFYSQKLN